MRWITTDVLIPKDLETSFKKLFITSKWDVKHVANKSVTSEEAIAMYYFIEKNKKYVDRLLYWCKKAEKEKKRPFPYLFDIKTGKVLDSVNTQHALWAAKMFFSEYSRSGEEKYLDRAVKIVNWLIDVMIIDDKKGRRFVNWWGSDGMAKKFNGRTSIKTFAAIDVLLELGMIMMKSKYHEIIFDQLNFMNNYMWDKELGIYYRDYNNKIGKCEQRGRPHPNLEVVEGLTNLCNKIDKIEDGKEYISQPLRNKALELIENIKKNCVRTNRTMPEIYGKPGQSFAAPLQLAYYARYYHLHYHKEMIEKVLQYRNKDGGWPGSLKNKTSNVFTHIYMMRLMKEIE